jgi:hypothetical protein
VIQKCDGRTLSQTPDGSIDLVHAHKVFVYTQFCITAGYLEEMARVVRPGRRRGLRHRNRGMPGRRDGPRVGSGRLVLPSYPQGMGGHEFMRRRGLAIRGSHFSPLPPGTTELLVFRRDSGSS